MAGSKYAATGTQNVTTPADSVLGITGTAAQRLWCHFFCLSSYATPADNAIFWTLQRYTAAGTSTVVTPVALDSADPASVGGVKCVKILGNRFVGHGAQNIAFPSSPPATVRLGD